MPSPSDSEIIGAIFGIVSSTPLDTLTAKKVRLLIESMFAISLSERKVWFRSQVADCLARVQQMQSTAKQTSPVSPPTPTSSSSSSSSSSSDSDVDGTPTQSAQAPTKKGTSTSSAEKKGKVPSTQLAAVLGPAVTANDARFNNFSVTKHLWAYIKEHQLQDPSQKRRILCDDKFRALTLQPSVDSFTMAKYVSQHLLDPSTPVSQRTVKVQPVVSKAKEDSRKRADGGGGSGSQEQPRKQRKGGGADAAELRQPVFSDALAAVTNGVRRGNNFSVTKLLWAYIKEHDLQDPKDRRTIVCDDKLAAVMGKDRVHMMKMAGLVRRHLIPYDEFVEMYGEEAVPAT
mmetsp:Transcript_8100/g.25896  ORF Transcript_8100/g.25896 Transcript_8100/m.25896 type:complete len:344 (+) Transcript_8100:75-1106(+)